MRIKIFKWSILGFIVVMALVIGGAMYQAISIVPFWKEDLSMFKNYNHWGADYFPILSPLMTLLWIITLISGWSIKIPKKIILNIAHIIFFLIILVTGLYFVPFLSEYMGNPGSSISDVELAQKLDVWAMWDLVRQLMSPVLIGMFIFSYGKIAITSAAVKESPKL